jgi:hypothetical protein
MAALQRLGAMNFMYSVAECIIYSVNAKDPCVSEKNPT